MVCRYICCLSVKSYLNIRRPTLFLALLSSCCLAGFAIQQLKIPIREGKQALNSPLTHAFASPATLTHAFTPSSLTIADIIQNNANRVFTIRTYGILAQVQQGKEAPKLGYDFPEGQEEFKHCAFKNCKLVSSHSEAEVVIVETMALDWGLITPPLPRLDGQLWVAHTWEPPPIMRKLPWSRLEGSFHLILSYQKSADIYSPYGSCYAKQPDDTGKTGIFKYLGSKTKKVAWFVSNCNPQSDRQRYVNELQKYIQVDVYGKCGNNTCEQWWQNVNLTAKPCFDLLRKDYKFYLAFENSLCQDYVTEKVWLNFGLVVPIVMGLTNYSAILPPHSFIDIRDFSSARALAEYLHTLDKDPEKYAAYFEWTRTYDCHYRRHEDSWQCRTCEYLNKHAFTKQQLARPAVSFDDLANVSHACVTPDEFYRNILY